jgi:protein-arginine kinase activator protein McsA
VEKCNNISFKIKEVSKISIIICINCGKLIRIRKDDKKGLCSDCINGKEQEIISLFKAIKSYPQNIALEI